MTIYISFFISLLVLSVLMGLFNPLQQFILNGIQRLSQKAFFSSEHEAPKFAIIRIGLGIVITIRGLNILTHLGSVDFSNYPVIIYALFNLFAGILLIIGILTQFVFAYLIFIQWQGGDAILGTSTLGNDVGAILALLLMITNAGRYLSFDSWLINRFPNLCLNRFLLYYKSDPSKETITTAKFITLFSYWLVCIYSLSMHLNEPAWMTGVAGPLLLTSNFMSSWHKEFTELFVYSQAATFAAKTSLWIMLPWYFGILPFVLAGGILRKFIIYWGILFFILSGYVLQLGWLAEIEFLFWAGLFWSKRGIQSSRTYEVAFDDKCNLCDRTVQFIRHVDIFDHVNLRPLSHNIEWLHKNGISEEAALSDLHGIDKRTNHIYRGYDFYVKLAQEIVVLWPLYPILLAGKYLAIGPIIYRWVAERRRKLFGVCTLPSQKRQHRIFNYVGADRFQSKAVSIIAAHVLVLGLFYIIAIPAPYIGYQGFKNPLANAAHIYGITEIDVFNSTDLKMSENWFTLSLVQENKEILVPIFAEDGSRLLYHQSDRVYFGNTLRFRRLYIGKPGCFFKQERKRILYLTNLYLRKNDLDPNHFNAIYRQYHRKLPDASLIKKNIYVVPEVELRCQINYSALK